MNNLCFVTSNENKVEEVENILRIKVNSVNLDIDEIQAIEVEDVVRDKAQRAFDVLKKSVLVEDTGLYIENWKGFPGALIKWVLKTLGNEGLCKILGDFDKTATAKTCICLYNRKETKVFSGEIKGIITDTPKGKNGFGWDPIFQPKGYEKTFAEMTQEEKDKISMRKQAIKKLKDFLDTNPGFLKDCLL